MERKRGFKIQPKNASEQPNPVHPYPPKKPWLTHKQPELECQYTPNESGASHRHRALQQPSSFPPITPPLRHPSPRYPYLPHWSTHLQSFQHGLTSGDTIFASNPNPKPTYVNTSASSTNTTSAELELQEQPFQQPIPPKQIKRSSSRRTFQRHMKRKNNKKNTTLNIKNKNKL
jgi:hypothetical protein